MTCIGGDPSIISANLQVRTADWVLIVSIGEPPFVKYLQLVIAFHKMVVKGKLFHSVKRVQD